MDSDRRFDALIERLRSDTLSGASELAEAAAEGLRTAVSGLPAESREELRAAIAEVTRRMIEAQPDMASLSTLARAVDAAARASSGLDEARVAASRAAAAFHDRVAERRSRIARHATEVIPGAGLVGTISASSTVRAALSAIAREAREPGRLRVLCFESRPMREGRDLAEALAREGLPVEYAVDAAVHALVPRCDVVVVGVDSIGDRGVVGKIGSAGLALVGKIGSAGLALAARDAGVPFHVLADETKLLPRGHPQEPSASRPGGEVWDAPAGVTIWNRYFELLPREHVSSFVTEHGVLSASEVEERRSSVLPHAERS